MGCANSTAKPKAKVPKTKFGESAGEPLKADGQIVPNSNSVPHKIKDNTYNAEHEAFLLEILEKHNVHRRNHGAPDLVINLDLCRIAQDHSDDLTRRNAFEHSKCLWGSKKIGENVAMMIGGKLTAENMTNMWYDEIKEYDFNNQGFSLTTGHFTQLVWRGTEEVGFGISERADNTWIGVGNYYPPGNYSGQYENNVFPLKTE